MKRITLAGLLGALLYSGAAFAGLLWSEPADRKLQWGSEAVVTTAQYFCSELTAHGRNDWRLPTESELLNDAPKGLSGVFWSANGIPFLVKHKPMAVAVDVGRREHLYREPHTKQLVVCVNDQF
jgi:hypothetical protein